MKSTFYLLAGLAIVLGLLLSYFFVNKSSGHNEPLRETEHLQNRSPESNSENEAHEPKQEITAAKSIESVYPHPTDLIASFKGYLLGLSKQSDPQATLAAIERFMADLRNLGPQKEVAKALNEGLRATSDIKTGLEFLLDRGGNVISWPSYKGILLQLLSEKDPGIASSYALTSLESYESSDLVPFALRILGKTMRDSPEFTQLAQRVLSYEPWLQEGSKPFLYGFDAIVFSADSQFADQLVQFSSDRYPKSVQYASYLALKRMTQSDPQGVVSFLVTSGTTESMKPSKRAEFFSLLDPSDSSQAQMIHQYLSNDQISMDELNRFVGYFPNLDVLFTRNILSENRLPNVDDRIRRLTRAKEMIPNLANTVAFQNNPDQLSRLESKIDELLLSAKRGGHI